MLYKDSNCKSAEEMSSSVGTKTVNITDDERNDNAMKVMKELIKQKYSVIVAAGIVGNMWTESRWNPTTVITDSNGLESIGLCQWNASRNTALRKFAKNKGKNWQDIDIQIAYLISELTESNFNRNGKNGYSAFMNAKTPQEAAKLFCYYWERPKECAQERMNYAYSIYVKYNNL